MEHELSPLIDPTNLAVVLIDMQDRFADGWVRKRLVPHQIAVIEACNKNNIPLIIVKYRGDGEIISELREKIEMVSSQCRHEIIKDYENAFLETGLDFLLRQLRVKKLLLMGVTICACVLETAQDAVNKGYEVITSNLLIGKYCDYCNHEEINSWYIKNGKFFENKIPLFQTRVSQNI